ncbi:hypothetical protein AB9P05_15605 [Roseivirga sp. BDSF3-8]|uniref:hypothetical protein n=1 Tax=Roseivirga sp. BDSF3-8 TaxID=3241598 RepID=UPI003531C1F7
MFNLDILEIAIGLIFIYLLFSMLVTLLNEYINALLKLRGENLYKAILNMLNSEMVEKFYNHHLIKSLSKNRKKRPSYISPGVFAKVIMDLMAEEKANENKGTGSILKANLKDIVSAKIFDQSSVMKLLKSFAEEVNYDANRFAVKLEAWFEEVMDRAKGWYVRKIRRVTLVVSIVVAIAFNVDSIRAYRALSENADLRTDIVGMASDFLAENPDGAAGNTASDIRYEAARDSLVSFYAREISPVNNMFNFGYGDEQLTYIGKHPFSAFLGWILTAFAISLGAPFWFDILNKVMSLRSALKPKSKDEEGNPNTIPPDMPPSTISSVVPPGTPDATVSPDSAS